MRGSGGVPDEVHEEGLLRLHIFRLGPPVLRSAAICGMLHYGAVCCGKLRCAISQGMLELRRVCRGYVLDDGAVTLSMRAVTLSRVGP